MKRSFLAGLALALGALGVLVGVALSQENPAQQPPVNEFTDTCCVSDMKAD
ncbi:hypothetical protein GCM10011609_65440 [Lentzea pudingi]|uniref:Secreted protein n=1 Tax=Lentzea pudingi TaxID=1789439 RepID=A0ABQ2IPD3_9PSEU|nr:hypothetical protein [Lentzea pudingi]GGN15725.1 hypothetical protein GCM10011609_65440 [Lentzea pudingi]